MPWPRMLVRPLGVPALVGLAALVLAACRSADLVPPVSEICNGYAPWTSTIYVLPYPVGTSYRVIQGNCAPGLAGHRGVSKYAYDFDMAIGTPFTAARAGVVVSVVESHVDGEIAITGKDNYVAIRHDDGSVALYGHLTHDGAVVQVGDLVQAGGAIGLSGNTGNTANIPHLHFGLHTCNPVTGGSTGCPTVPVTFRNTDPNPNGLQNGQVYPARGY